MTGKRVLVSRPKDDSLESFKAWMQEMIKHLTGRTKPDGSLTDEEWVEMHNNFVRGQEPE